MGTQVEYHCSAADKEIIAFAMLRYLHTTDLPDRIKHQYEALYLRLVEAECVVISQ